jgi:hypothetical protein
MRRDIIKALIWVSGKRDDETKLEMENLFSILV